MKIGRASRAITASRLLCVALMGGCAVPALAQSASQAATEQPTVPADDGNLPSDDIVVTALKRGTRLQETPISISAISSESLANSGAQSIANLAATVPSLNIVDAGPSNRRVVIRGIQSAGEPTVGVYYDETPVTGAIGASNDAGGTTPEFRLFDVERVEVLRGPQGTLYGSGSMSGTMRIIYKKPDFTTSGATDLSLSGTEHGGVNYEANAVLNTPIIADKVAVRIAGYYRFNDGYIDNTFLHINGINSEKSYGGRALLLVKPTDRLTIDLAAYYNKSDTDTPTWLAEDGKYKTDNRTRLPIRDRLGLYSGTATYRFDGFTATGILSYMNRELASSTDTSRFISNMRTPTACQRNLLASVRPCTTGSGSELQSYYALVDSQFPSQLYPQQNVHALTGELRLNSNGGGALNWTVGGFYSRRSTDVLNPQLGVDPATGVMISPPQYFVLRRINDILTQYAGFAEASWDIAPRLNLTAGVRFFRYTRDVGAETKVGSILIGAKVTPNTVVTGSESGKVFKFNASYKITRNIMLYAVAAQGFRPGGVNQVFGLPQALTPYEADRLWNYEAGIKTSFLDHHIVLNVDVFRIDWSNMQISARTANGAFAFITNAGAAQVNGVEMDTTIRPVAGLSIQGSMAYIDAKLTRNQANPQVLAPGLRGDPVPYVPKFSTGIGVQYDAQLDDKLKALFRVDVNHTSSTRSDFRPFSSAAPYTRNIAAYNLINLRVGVETRASDWGAYLYVTNLFGSTAISRAFSNAIATGLTSVTSARPRTIGLNVRKAF